MATIKGERALIELARLAYKEGFTLESIRLRAPISDNKGPWSHTFNYETDFGTVWITKAIG